MRVFISTSLAYLLCFHLSYGQNRTVVINEFMFDPTPQVELPDVEYVEIHNVTSNAIQLDGWSLNEHLIPDYVIQPYDYLVLCESGSTDLFNTTINVLGMSRWDRLNNTGQPILLKDRTLNTVDSISYDNKWITDPVKANGGWSLELVKPGKACSDKENWSVSISSTGGTPGFQNSVFNNAPDVVAPYVLEAICLDPFTIQLTFSETVNFSGSYPTDLFDINPGDMLMNMSYQDFANVQLIGLSNPMNIGMVYNLTIQNISDCEGNYISDTIIHVGIGLDPHFNEIMITELLVDEIPSYGLPESEYIEILNNSNKLIELKNTYIYTDSKIFELPEYQMFPHEYYLLIPMSKAELFRDYTNTMEMERFPRLNNEGKLLGLYNIRNGLIFSLHYNLDWYKDYLKSNGGYSLEMIDLINPCGDINNWTASTAEIGGTPGKANSINIDNPDLSGPEITSANAFEVDQITIQFNEKLHPDCFRKLLVWVDDFDMQNKWSYDTIRINRIDIEVPYTLSKNIQYSIRISGIEDCVGNRRKNENNPLIIRLPQQADSSDIVINEILFNPRPGGVDWIEIYNLSDKLFNLRNWYLMNEKSQTSQIEYQLSGEHFILEPYSFIVLTESKDKLISDFPNSNSRHILEMTDFPSMPDSEGYISLWTSENERMDELFYNQNQHNLFLKNKEGVSLERVSPLLPASEAANWQSASSDSGFGTPTMRNSQYFKRHGNEHEIIISPLIFSPDQDGHEDYLNIQMNNPKPGFVSNIHIFDVNGALIKNLALGYLMGITNRITWDGFTDKGYIARPGYYILLLEIFHPDGDYSIHKKKFVLGKRFY
jgi:hypothetical protein